MMVTAPAVTIINHHAIPNALCVSYIVHTLEFTAEKILVDNNVSICTLYNYMNCNV